MAINAYLVGHFLVGQPQKHSGLKRRIDLYGAGLLRLEFLFHGLVTMVGFFDHIWPISLIVSLATLCYILVMARALI